MSIRDQGDLLPKRRRFCSVMVAVDQRSHNYPEIKNVISNHLNFTVQGQLKVYGFQAFLNNNVGKSRK